MDQTTAINALAALAQETRLAAFRLLVRAGPNGLTAGEIAQALGVGAPTLSHHLATLERAGLVGSLRRGRTVVYAVAIEGMRALIAFLTEDCCEGRPDLCGSALAAPACIPETCDDR